MGAYRSTGLRVRVDRRSVWFGVLPDVVPGPKDPSTAEVGSKGGPKSISSGVISSCIYLYHN